MEVLAPGSSPPPETQCHSLLIEGGFDDSRLREVIASGSLEFGDWISLISFIEDVNSDINRLSLVYDAFLTEFPLCHVYWKKYAGHLMRLSGTEKAVEVFERAVLAVTYSVGLWVEYCQFASSVFEDPDDVRRLFKRAMSYVGKDYSCHSLWDMYIEFELSQQCWSSVAHIFLQTLRFPTKKLHYYYESLEKLVTIWEEEMNSAMEPEPEADPKKELQASSIDEEICDVINKLLDSSDGCTRLRVLKKYKAIGEWLYKKSCLLDEKIICFESNIHRSWFHVKPIDSAELENWHRYLDFVERENDFEWAVKLYERCLIPAANYTNFWMRYVVYMESKGGREIANFALDRATKIFSKDMPIIHVYNARFKEATRDVMGARAALLQLKTEFDENFVDHALIKASMEKRMGNHAEATNIYCEAIERAISKKELKLLPTLYVHYSQHIYVTTNSSVAARDILIDGIKHMPSSKLLYEELIKFVTTHGGKAHLDVVGSVIGVALLTISGKTQTMDSNDQKYISNLYLKYVDLCGTIHDVTKAWDQHMKIFPPERAASVKSPTGTKTWKFLLDDKHKASARKPSVDIQVERSSLPESAAFSSKEVLVGHNSSGRGHQTSNRLSEQSMEDDDDSFQGSEHCSEDKTARSNEDSAVDQHHLPATIEALSFETPKHSISHLMLDRWQEVEDTAELSVPNQVGSSGNIAEIGHSQFNSEVFNRTENQTKVSPPPYSSSHGIENHFNSETQSQWRQMNHSDRAHRDLRYQTRGYLPRRPHLQKQLNTSEPQQPLMEVGQTSFPVHNQQNEPGNHSGNQFQSWANLNYDFAAWYPGQVPSQNVIYPQVQLPNHPFLQDNDQIGEQSRFSQAYYNQIWHYYYYYQQQQLFVQQQMQQLLLTLAQLQQQEQSPEYQQILQHLSQLQQQQHQLYQLQQQLYQQLQIQQQPHQGVHKPQDQLFDMHPQLSQLQQSLQHEQLDQTDHKDQELQLQQEHLQRNEVELKEEDGKRNVLS